MASSVRASRPAEGGGTGRWRGALMIVVWPVMGLRRSLMATRQPLRWPSDVAGALDRFRRAPPTPRRRSSGPPPGSGADGIRAKALGVDLVDVLGAGRPRREPAALGHHLQPADRRAVAGGPGEDRQDLSPGQLGGLDLLRARALPARPSRPAWPAPRRGRRADRRIRA